MYFYLTHFNFNLYFFLIEETNIKQKKKYVQAYKSSWEISRPWLTSTNNQAYCKTCVKSLANNVSLLNRQIETPNHQKKTRENSVTENIITVLQNSTQNKSLNNKKRLEIKFVMYIIEHNLQHNL